MILAPVDSAMDKRNTPGGLHRGDTVRTMGPPSYNSAIEGGALSSSSSPARKHLPPIPQNPYDYDMETSSSSLAPPPPTSISGSSSKVVLSSSSWAPSSTASLPMSPPSPSRSSSSSTSSSSRSRALSIHPMPPRHPAHGTLHGTASTRSTVRSHSSSPSLSTKFDRTNSNLDSLSDPHKLTDAAVINGVHTVTNDAVTGSWRLDPDLPPVGKPPKKIARPRRAKKAMVADPNLSLETKSANIAARIAVVGRENYAPRKAFIRVTTRVGKVNIDIKEQTMGRFFDLDVYSKNGETIILVPRSFRGVIDLQTLKGDLVVRPALASAARTLKSSKEEMLLLVGGASTESTELMDFVRFKSEGGASLAIGYTVEDDIIVPPHGFWKKFGLIMQGKSTRPKEKSAVPAQI